MSGLGELERAIMDHLWATPGPQTVRQVYEALASRRKLAYTTVMTVLQRLAKKGLVTQERNDRAHRYQPVNRPEDLVASLMMDALGEAENQEDRLAALVRFVGQVEPSDARALRAALRAVEEQHPE
jgi:predicted transcriptional regulator